MENFKERFETFLAGAKTKISEDTRLEYSDGKRYIKVIQIFGSTAHSQCSFCFVDKTNGDVLKAASWYAPAKIARGNIFDEFNGLKLIGQWGPICFLQPNG